MARIRSIKPDFFTSEKIAALPLSARLLFIGLWTHVDDNGVAPDNEKLINAAVWPLEDDPRESLLRTREDLRRLSTVGLVVRYEHSGKALLYIRNWDEHQKVSHPAKSRYERPTDEQIRASEMAVTRGNTPPDDGAASPSGNPPEILGRTPEILAPEQGAGSREQGAGIPPTAGAVAPGDDDGEPPPQKLTITQRSKRITDAYAAVEPMCKWPGINGIVIKAIKAEKWADIEIHDALLRLADEGRGVTVETLRRELAGTSPLGGRDSPAQSRNAQILNAARQRALAAEQQSNVTHLRGAITA